MKVICSRLVSLVVLTAFLVACQSEPPLEADFAFVGVNVVDVETGQVAENQTVLIAAGKIAEVAPFADLTVSNRVKAVFAGGKYLIPGLYDSHVHAFADTDAAVNKTLPLFIANGVTHIRDMGTTLENLRKIEIELKQNPRLPHPHYFSTGPIIDSYKLPWYGNLQAIIKTPEEASDVVSQLQSSGITQLKTYSNLSPAVYQSIADEARLRGLELVGHLPRNVSLREAAGTGQLTLEHLEVSTTVSCAPQGRPWFDDSIQAKFGADKSAYLNFMGDYWTSLNWNDCGPAWQAFASAGGHLTPTLVMETTDEDLALLDDLRFLDAAAEPFCQQGLKAMSDFPEARERSFMGLKNTLNKIRDAGVPILAGSDTPNNCLVPGFSLHWELKRLVDFGLTPLEALQSATVTPDLAFTGTPRRIQAGDDASLVLLDKSPVADINALRSIVGVYVKQRWWNREDLDQLKTNALQFTNEQKN